MMVRARLQRHLVDGRVVSGSFFVVILPHRAAAVCSMTSDRGTPNKQSLHFFFYPPSVSKSNSGITAPSDIRYLYMRLFVTQFDFTFTFQPLEFQLGASKNIDQLLAIIIIIQTKFPFLLLSKLFRF